MRTIFPKENEGSLDSRTDSAPILAKSEQPEMRFPKVIRHRKAEVTIYDKKPNYAFYRISYRSGGKRHLRNFSKYGDALKDAEKKVRELADGSQAASLTAAARAHWKTLSEVPSLKYKVVFPNFGSFNVCMMFLVLLVGWFYRNSLVPSSA
jgi:hypothetical protein